VSLLSCLLERGRKLESERKRRIQQPDEIARQQDSKKKREGEGKRKKKKETSVKV
jgi:hypothetical protein